MLLTSSNGNFSKQVMIKSSITTNIVFIGLNSKLPPILNHFYCFLSGIAYKLTKLPNFSI